MLMSVYTFKEDDFQFIDHIDLSEERQREVWIIRNLNIVRRHMIHSTPFSFERHLLFIKALRMDRSRLYWSVFRDDKFISSISLHPINWGEAWAEWGIYMNPFLVRKGDSYDVSNAFFRYIRANTALQKIYASISFENNRSIKFHEKIGFEFIGGDRVLLFEKRL